MVNSAAYDIPDFLKQTKSKITSNKNDIFSVLPTAIFCTSQICRVRLDCLILIALVCLQILYLEDHSKNFKQRGFFLFFSKSVGKGHWTVKNLRGLAEHSSLSV